MPTPTSNDPNFVPNPVPRQPTHPAVLSLLKFFSYAHLPPHLQEVSQPISDLAQHMVATLPSNAELTVGLRKLLEAKDCFVRAKL